MWKDTLKGITPLSEEWLHRAKAHLDNLTKPRGSLGVLEEIAARVVAIREEKSPSLDKKGVFLFVGDHDIVEEGVSAYPQEVTGLMVQNFLAGGAAINVLARSASATVTVVDVGMKTDVPPSPGFIQRKIRRGAANFSKGPAMTLEEAEKALEVGIEMAERAFLDKTFLLATGDMGIGNTSPSAAIFAALLPADLTFVTGRGTGLDDQGLQQKIKVLTRALEVNSSRFKDPLSTLAAVGGYEIAAICGLCLGGAARRMIVVVDGFISSAGALVAMRLDPNVKDYLFFSHRSSEKGHRAFFEKEGLRPILDLDLRLGEGTGATLAMKIIEDSIKIYNEMASFQEVGIEPGA